MTDSVQFSCKQSPLDWYWLPAPLLATFAANVAPSEIFLQRFHAVQPTTHSTLELGAMSVLFQTFAQALGTNYFERYKVGIKEKYGNVADWPSTWNFARVVRNAMAHGGKISILNSSEPPVTWKGLTYSYADNGKDILCKDLWPGDLFDLIEDLDKEL